MNRRLNLFCNIPFPLLWVAITLIYSLFITIEFLDNPVGSFIGFVTIAAQWLELLLCAGGLIGLLMLNKYILAVTLTPLMLISSVLAYYRVTAGITLTPTIIELTFQSNVRTAMTIVTWQFILLLTITIAVSVFLTLMRFKCAKVKMKHYIVYGLIAVLLMSLQYVPKFHRAIAARLPYSLYYCMSEYEATKREVQVHRDTYDKVDFHCASDSLTVVVLLGESLRPDHMQINGYQRATTPLLMKQSNIISFPYVTTDYTHTYSSLPHIMTEPVAGDPDAAYDRQSFITPLKKAGFFTSWISNQNEMDSYSYFMHETDTLVRNNPGGNAYVFNKRVDGEVLPEFDRLLKPSAVNQCIILHCAGSHWLYTTHFPDEMAVFKPNVKSRIMTANTHEEIINSYDNTVFYTDYFINEIIERLKTRKAVLILQSDHGEALGEGGKYLHGFENPGVAKTACFIWYSDSYKAENGTLIDSLRSASNRHIKTTHMFNTVLNCANVSCVK